MTELTMQRAFQGQYTSPGEQLLRRPTRITTAWSPVPTDPRLGINQDQSHVRERRTEQVAHPSQAVNVPPAPSSMAHRRFAAP